MEIKSISQKIFRTSPKVNENNASHTNPFGVNFKGKMISADVFESAEKTGIVSNIAEKVGNKCKMLTSAIVGSIGDMNSAISSRLNSVVDFGRRVKENINGLGLNISGGLSRTWDYLNNTNLFITMGLRKNYDRLSLAEKALIYEDLVNAKVMEATV